MLKMCKIKNKGSATIETTLIMGIVLTVIILIIYTSFFLHDYTVTSAQIKYNLMQDKQEFKSIMFMGNLEDIKTSKKNNKRSYNAKLNYYFPIIGNTTWKMDINNEKGNIDNIRKLKVLNDGMELLK